MTSENTQASVNLSNPIDNTTTAVNIETDEKFLIKSRGASIKINTDSMLYRIRCFQFHWIGCSELAFPHIHRCR